MEYFSWLMPVLKVAFAGGIGAVIGGYIFPHLLQTHKFKQDKLLEAHKMALQRQELIFGRTIKAADDFMDMYRHIFRLPTQLDMDDYEYAESLSPSQLDAITRRIEAYLIVHSAVLAENVREAVEGALYSANRASLIYAQSDDPEMPSDAHSSTVDMLKSIGTAHNAIIQSLKI